MKFIKTAFVFLFIANGYVWAQTPPTYNSSDIYRQLQQLKVLGSVLYIAAHPDDENNNFLPYLTKEKLYRTGYLSLTRGDGGQNLLGSEQGIELGMIRTQELLAARRIDGAEQYFSSAYEFGFSKSFDETLSIWNKEKILGDVVWVIRQFQPDIIIARFPPDARAGHGHHSASAIIAQEAFAAAADSTQYPEQLKQGVSVWQAKRILWNTFNFGNVNTTDNNQLKIDIGAYNNLLGKSYGEIGAEARSMHKSQGEGRPRRRGALYEYFVTTGGDTAKNNLMDGIATDWSRIKGGEKISMKIDTIINHYNIHQPELSIPALVDLYEMIFKELPWTDFWVKKKLEEIQDLIEHCAGLYLEATTNQEYATLDDSVKISYFVNMRNNANAQWTNYWSDSAKSFTHIQLQQNTNYVFDKNIIIDKSAEDCTQPYWLQLPQQDVGSFEIPNQQMAGKAWNDPCYTAAFYITINGKQFRFKKPVQYKYTHPSKGELYEPFAIRPQISLHLSPHVFLTNIKNEKGNSVLPDSNIHVIFSPTFTQKQVPVSLYVLQDVVKPVFENRLMDFEKNKNYMFDIPVSKYCNTQKGNYVEVAIKAKINGVERTFTSYFKTIAYDHIPDINYMFKDYVKFVNEEVKTAGHTIGYIPGAGDLVPDALLQMGYQVTTLGEKDITGENLKQFDAIVTGVRAYNMFGFLTEKYDVLMNYIKNGGNLIVQYNRNNLTGSEKAKIAPYDFTINGSSRITDENAKVSFLLPQHSVLNYPNKITDKDFENWVQERSTYQAERIDGNYEAVLGMNDKGEKQSSGSLIIAKYGKGNFVYTGLVFFRQLPAGNPGAFRLMANIIALPKN